MLYEKPRPQNGEQIVKEFLAKHSLEVIGIAIAVIIPLVAAWIERRHRKKTEEDRKLRVHFEELKKEAEPVISFALGLGNRYGKIVTHEKSVVSIF